MGRLAFVCRQHGPLEPGGSLTSGSCEQERGQGTGWGGGSVANLGFHLHDAAQNGHEIKPAAHKGYIIFNY